MVLTRHIYISPPISWARVPGRHHGAEEEAEVQESGDRAAEGGDQQQGVHHVPRAPGRPARGAGERGPEGRPGAPYWDGPATGTDPRLGLTDDWD